MNCFWTFTEGNSSAISRMRSRLSSYAFLGVRPRANLDVIVIGAVDLPDGETGAEAM